MTQKPSRRFIWIPLILISLLFVLSVQAVSSQERVTIRYSFWGLPEEVEVQEQLKAAFEAQNPNIEVQLDHVSGAGDFAANMLTQIAGGNPPDVFYLGEALVSSFASRNVLLDLMPYVERDNIDLSAYWEATIDPVVDDEGRMWAFPKDNGPYMVYYNRDMFDAAGLEYPTADWTWEQFVEAAQQLTLDTNSDGTVDQWGIALDYWWAPYITAVYNNGGQILNEERNECRFTDPATVEAIQNMADLMIGENAVAPSPGAITDMGVGTLDLFLSSRAAMFTAGRWGAFFIRNFEGNWGVAPFPSMNGEPSNVTLFVNLVIPSTAQHPDEAWEFIKFVIGEEGQRINASTGLGLPVLKSVTEAGEWLQPGEPEDNVEMYLAGFERAQSLPFHPQWAETMDEIAGRELDPVWRGEVTAEQVAQTICDQINPIISGN